ncbi:hypothetical protein CAPTEDRAFT_220469 [Capitella teleta]|uniref:PNT domain-containing protein n=1 Tax=Capitella teleta TaxID=283909 RepID=R7TD80_CAPTE|nr:hypothetical protein CAPTEDRAFT_220469 [Capitella teleta]|eukprot:ELT91447.1 hypothetical protein CAPTEDRAFT_220469 [Capitella teleta]
MALDLSVTANFPISIMRQSRGICRITRKKTKQRKQLSWSLTKTLLQHHKETSLHEQAEAPRNERLQICCAVDDNCSDEARTPEDIQRCSAQMAPACTPFDPFPLPEDPREWSRLDVRTWISHMKSAFDLVDVSADRFPMNGKALCLMTPEMFSFRVPSAGRLLFRDFRLRLAKAMHSVR